LLEALLLRAGLNLHVGVFGDENPTMMPIAFALAGASKELSACASEPRSPASR
jgi:hypothetical protein